MLGSNTEDQKSRTLQVPHLTDEYSGVRKWNTGVCVWGGYWGLRKGVKKEIPQSTYY